MILQPKRWESSEHPRYDPIRHLPWFWRLEKRKKVLPRMEGCYTQWVTDHSNTQEELCDIWNVSPREFRDYCAFMSGAPKLPSKEFQYVLDDSYHAYCFNGANKPIQFYMQRVARAYGLNYRHVWEMWEVNPIFYPSNYTIDEK